MKQFIYLLAFAFLNVPVYSQASQTPVEIKNLKVSATAKQVLFSWSATVSDADANFEVQVSENGKEFKTIGLVWGTDPKGARGSYSFKADAAKLKAGETFFRVIQIASNETAWSSNIARL